MSSTLFTPIPWMMSIVSRMSQGSCTLCHMTNYIYTIMTPLLNHFVFRQPGRLVGERDQEKVRREGPVHHQTVWRLRDREARPQLERHQHARREHR